MEASIKHQKPNMNGATGQTIKVGINVISGLFGQHLAASDGVKDISLYQDLRYAGAQVAVILMTVVTGSTQSWEER